MILRLRERVVLPVLHRRSFVQWAAAAALAFPVVRAQPQPRRPYLGDMHSHHAMFRSNPRTVDLREVADKLAQRNWSDAALQDVCIGNYARVLKMAMSA